MWNPIVSVARSQRLDEKKLTSFALQNVDKYSIVIEHGSPEVSTWNVNKLLADFKASEK